MILTELNEKLTFINSLEELNKIIDNEELYDKNEVDIKFVEINNLAIKMYFCKSIKNDFEYIDFRNKLQFKLLEFFNSWGTKEEYHYSMPVDCLWKKYKGNDISTEVLYKTIKETTETYDYNRNNKFHAYFFYCLSVNNERFFSNLRNDQAPIYEPSQENDDDEEPTEDKQIVLEAAVIEREST